MNISFRKTVFYGLLPLLVWASSSASAYADHILVYFDVSDSITQKIKESFYHDFKSLEFHPGDKVIVLPLGRDTQSFTPVAKVDIPRNNASFSAEKNREIHEAALRKLRSSVMTVLQRKETVTYILGALISSNDYFSQEKIPPAQRQIYIFSDMIEENPRMNFRRKIPVQPPTDLPTGLNATVHVIGVTVDAGKQAALRQFWESTVKSTGSALATYRKSL